MDKRLKLLTSWLTNVLEGQHFHLEPLPGDASFRRYFRVLLNNQQSFMAMDAPPKLEDSHGFVAIAKAFKAKGIQTPIIHHEDLTQGFLLLTDFGDTLYLQALNEQSADKLYQQAMQSLITIQQCRDIPGWCLPSFDGGYIRGELANFREWFLAKYLQLPLSTDVTQVLDECDQILCDNAKAQPQVCIHRDYHSRNLMLLSDGSLGILDFQDAMLGPVTYDLASLIKDLYIDWPANKVQHWLAHYQQMATDAGIIEPVSAEVFTRWFELMAMQRHLKAIFIFARKFLRDNDDSYLADIPRGLNYIRAILPNYPELKNFCHYFEAVILPNFAEANVA